MLRMIICRLGLGTVRRLRVIPWSHFYTSLSLVSLETNIGYDASTFGSISCSFCVICKKEDQRQSLMMIIVQDHQTHISILYPSSDYTTGNGPDGVNEIGSSFL